MEQVRCVSYFKQGFDADDQGDFGKTTDGYSITTRPLHTINPPALAHALPERRTWQSIARHWPTVRARGVDAEGNVSITWLTLLGG